MQKKKVAEVRNVYSVFGLNSWGYVYKIFIKTDKKTGPPTNSVWIFLPADSYNYNHDYNTGIQTHIFNAWVRPVSGHYAHK